MTFILNNKWTDGIFQYEIDNLPQEMINAEGIMPINMVADPKIGTETVLLYFDPTEFIESLSKLSPFQLHLKAILIDTTQGPVGTFIFYIPRSFSTRKSLFISRLLLQFI